MCYLPAFWFFHPTLQQQFAMAGFTIFLVNGPMGPMVDFPASFLLSLRVRDQMSETVTHLESPTKK